MPQDSINVNNLKLLLSAVSKAQYPNTEHPELAFAGRSNVGKSSLINKLVRRKSFARTSSMPGKTATINFYEVDEKLMLVDLPGYGYAKRSKAEIEKWGHMMDDYFFSRVQLSGVILLIDSRHKPTGDDITMANFVRDIQKPLIVVATKLDKLKKSEIEKSLETIRQTLSLGADEPMYPFSAHTGAGRDEIWEQILYMAEAEI